MLNSKALMTELQGLHERCLFTNALVGILAAFGLNFLRLWIPNQDIDFIYLLLIITIVGHLIEGVSYPMYYTYTLTLKNKVPCFLTILSGLLNVIGMVVMIKYFNMGAISVVLTTTVLAWLMHIIFTPIYVSHCLELQWHTFYKTYGKIILSALVIAGACYGISILFSPQTWAGFIFVAAICLILSAFIHVLITLDNFHEFNEIKRLLIKK